MGSSEQHKHIRGGFVLQPRSWDSSDAAHFPPIVREVWFWILRNVSYKTNGSCSRGQGFFTLSDIQEALSWMAGYRRMKYSKPQLTKSLRKLREGNMIATAKETRGIRVTVLKYDIYQNPDNYESNNEGTTKEPRKKRSGHTIDKNVKNEQECNPPRPAVPSGGVSQTFHDSQFQDAALGLSDWFAAEMKPDGIPVCREKWSAEFEKILRLDGFSSEQIKKAVTWARTDTFWSENFKSPMKLRKRDRDGEMYIRVFLRKAGAAGGVQRFEQEYEV